MAHKDPERRRAYWRGAQSRRRARQREDAQGELQSQLRASASAGMGGRTTVTRWFSADRTDIRTDLEEGADWRSVGRVWVPEIPVARIHDAIERLRARDRQLTLLALIPSLSAPEDWPTFLAAAEAAAQRAAAGLRAPRPAASTPPGRAHPQPRGREGRGSRW